HTFGEDTANLEQLESTLMRLCEMVCRRLREHGLHARTVQLKLRYKDFSTFTRAHTLAGPTQLDTEIFEEIRKLFRKNWEKGEPIRLLGVHASSFEKSDAQLNLLEAERHQRWKQALSAADRLRDKYGESSVSLASGMRVRSKAARVPREMQIPRPARNDHAKLGDSGATLSARRPRAAVSTWAREGESALRVLRVVSHGRARGKFLIWPFRSADTRVLVLTASWHRRGNSTIRRSLSPC